MSVSAADLSESHPLVPRRTQNRTPKMGSVIWGEGQGSRGSAVAEAEVHPVVGTGGGIPLCLCWAFSTPIRVQVLAVLPFRGFLAHSLLAQGGQMYLSISSMTHSSSMQCSGEPGHVVASLPAHRPWRAV